MTGQIKKIWKENVVTLVFIVLCLLGFAASGQTFSYVFSEVSSRLFRNFGLVFSLVIPVIAGIGLNFGIVLGAMAAQAAFIFVTHWRFQGVAALVLVALISTPLSILFGWLLGKLFNKTKGQEMITGMITGFFANGIYQLFFLVLIGTLIPMKDDRIMIYNGIGIKDTLKFEDSVANALDNIWKVRLDRIYWVFVLLGMVCLGILIWKTREEKAPGYRNRLAVYGAWEAALLVVLALCLWNGDVQMALKFTSIPMVPLILMVLMGLMVNIVLKTKLGQDFRAIGTSQKVAAASGIDVDRTRIVAIILSTILAAWGQIIFLQNIGNFNTYSSHEKVSLFAVAAILVGGASTRKATVKQCIIGIILFHTLFVIAPLAGKALLNDAAYGEYFREAISYGVITLSLVLHISSRKKGKRV
ncbi:MAG: ABC transporter permease [Lachnospiraceae bacterium]|nr:ABC transporter permease [Lachnospiraceae bacterium]